MTSASIRPASLVAVAAVCLLGGAALAAEPVRQASAWDRKELGRDYPGALAAFDSADALAAAGRTREAARAFEEVAARAPQSPAPLRRLCEVLTDAGDRAAALEACKRTLKYGDAPEDFRAMVAAMMLGKGPLPSDELVQALMFASGVEQRTPADPAGPAALFEVARRLGDRSMMKAQLRRLEALAPAHHDTARARRLVAGGDPGAGLTIAWLLLLALAGATAARVLGRLRPRPRVLNAASIAALLLSLLAPSAARAARPDPAKGLSAYPVDDADPAGHLPAPAELQANPMEFGYLVMDLAEKADQATKRKDYHQAARYYLAIAKLAPDRAIGFGKACEMYELLGDRADALIACRAALRIEGVRGEDYERFVRLVLASPQPLTEAEQNELATIVAHFEKLPDGARVAAQIDCKLGVRTEDVARLERCTGKLATLAPEDSAAVGYRWALATLKKDDRGARRVLDEARHAGLHPDGLDRMEALTEHAEHVRHVGYGAASVLVLAALILVARRRPLLARRSVG